MFKDLNIEFEVTILQILRNLVKQATTIDEVLLNIDTRLGELKSEIIDELY